MKTKNYLLFIVLMAVVPVTAKNRSLSEMQAIAAAKLNSQQNVKGFQGLAVNVDEIQCVSDEAAYGVFAPADGQGFVIVAKSDLVEPVWGYSTQPFPIADMPDGLRWFLKVMSFEAEKAEKKGTPLSTRHAAAAYTPVDNFITTKWRQDYPFNQLTPNNYWTGCVATALAQCMNYCRWPQSASFEGFYWVTTGSGDKAVHKDYTVNVSSTYNWPYKDTYKKIGRYGDNIDELLRDCGYATSMQYASDGSGTVTQYCGFALTQSFNYPEECVKTLCKDYDDGEQFNEIIYEELQRRSPVIMGAHDDEDGHAFVLCGSDANGLVYVNWGWAGDGDGFYDLTLMNPSGDNPEFVQSPRIVYGIRSTPLPEDHIVTRLNANTNPDTNAPGSYTFHFGTEKDNEGVSHPTLFINIPYGFENMNGSNFSGNVGIFGQDLTDGSTWVIAPELQDPEEIPAGTGWYTDDPDFYFYYFVDGEGGLKPGHTYRMSFGACDPREGVWHSVLCVGGERAYDVTYTGDVTTSTVNSTPQPVPLVDAISAPTFALQADAGTTRVYDIQGRMVYSAPTVSFNLWDIPARGILVVKQGDKVKKVIR